MERLVHEELRDSLGFVSQHEKRFVCLVMDKSQQEQKRDMAAKKKAAQIQTLDALETELAEQESQAVNVDRFLDTVHRNAEIEKLTPAIVHEFIDKIIIHEPEQARGNRRQKVEILYHKIGAVDLQRWQDESA